MPTSRDQYLNIAARAFADMLRKMLGDSLPLTPPKELGSRAALSVIAGARWGELVGPFTAAAGAAASLGRVSRQAVSQRVSAGTLLGLRLAGHRPASYVFPLWQFEGTILDHLPEILKLAAYDHRDAVTGWTIASWLTTTDERLGPDTKPIDRLAADDPGPVRELARELALELTA